VFGSVGAVLAISIATMLTFLFAQPLISLSVTRSKSDWYPKPWFLSTSECAAVLKTAAFHGGTRSTYEPAPGACAAQPQKQRIFVIGDSHAVALSTMFSKLAAEDRYSVTVYALPACPFLNLNKPVSAYPAPCPSFAAAAVAETVAETRRGDIIILAAFRMRRFGDQDAARPEAEVLASMFGPEASASREAAIGDAITWLDQLAKSNAEVVLMAPTPVFKAPAFRCSDWFNNKNPVCAPGLAITRAFMEDFRRPVVAAMDRVSAGRGDVHVWDALPALCPGETCVAASGETKPLFLDGDHLSGFGNLVMYGDFKRFMQTVGSR
jgi:hypothetical protein